jgi:hypothetical protein
MSSIHSSSTPVDPAAANEITALSPAASDAKSRVGFLVQPSASDEESKLIELTPELRKKIISLSQELFPGPVTIETEFDPEFPDDGWHAVEVEAHGEFREILDRELSWHDRIWELLGKDKGMQFRLSVIPK